jgi:uncharacterized SAM-binding protein YcdF (DUF218 family)
VVPLKPRRLRAAVSRTLLTVAAAISLWLIFAFQLFVNVDRPDVHRTDAVILLGGAGSERLPVARQVQSHFHIPVLVISQTDTLGNAAADAECKAAEFPSASLVCFRPNGLDTRGEARAIAHLVKANGWKSVTVVTSSYHVTRAERVIGQCTTAEIQMVASHPDLGLGQWLRRFVIESGGLVDVSMRPECESKGP